MLIIGSIVLAAILMAAEWQIWEPRYRTSAPLDSGSIRSQVVTGSKRQGSRRNVAGELAAALAPQALRGNVAARQGWIDHCSQG